uniref:F-box associated beta-propeller type 1 domain-containing protein n=1 Tax=Triticum urartu TaxID=4572 RepID=A0A8R7QW42_TRIUA
MPHSRRFASLDSCLNDLKLACQMQQLHRRVVSSKPCHGLLLMAHNNYGVHVCNPVTGAHVFHCSLPFEQPSDAAAAHPGCVGLGYDLLREEHIIMVLAYKSRNFDTGSYTMECSIRRLTDCMTKKVAPSPPIPVTVDVPPVYAGGKMYWMGESRFSAGCSSVLVFDICSKAFNVLPAPRTMGDSGRMLVAELARQIRVVHICPNTETMTIWRKRELVTLDDGQGWTIEHWIQLGQWPEFSLRTAARLVIPLAVDDAGRILLDTGRALGYYDPRNQTLETVFPTSSLQHSCPRFFSAVLCEDSLVRPYGRQRQYYGT